MVYFSLMHQIAARGSLCVASTPLEIHRRLPCRIGSMKIALLVGAKAAAGRF
jgi:hypothetical protein